VSESTRIPHANTFPGQDIASSYLMCISLIFNYKNKKRKYYHHTQNKGTEFSRIPEYFEQYWLLGLLHNSTKMNMLTSTERRMIIPEDHFLTSILLPSNLGQPFYVQELHSLQILHYKARFLTCK
jgi:hypothetical protein